MIIKKYVNNEGKEAAVMTLNSKVLIVTETITAEFKGIEKTTEFYEETIKYYDIPQDAKDFLFTLGYIIEDGSAGL